MENHYSTLRTLLNIAEEHANPVQYLCTSREMILHSTFDWDLIYKHLVQLSEMDLVKIIKADTLQFSITQKGVEALPAVQEDAEAKDLQLTIKGNAARPPVITFLS